MEQYSSISNISQPNRNKLVYIILLLLFFLLIIVIGFLVWRNYSRKNSTTNPSDTPLTPLTPADTPLTPLTPADTPLTPLTPATQSGTTTLQCTPTNTDKTWYPDNICNRCNTINKNRNMYVKGSVSVINNETFELIHLLYIKKDENILIKFTIDTKNPQLNPETYQLQKVKNLTNTYKTLPLEYKLEMDSEDISNVTLTIDQNLDENEKQRQLNFESSGTYYCMEMTNNNTLNIVNELKNINLNLNFEN